jgi:hypothetical protein
MEVEINAQAREKHLNSGVAITVVVLSVFMALCKIKDDNIVQAMQQAKADAVDTWGEYQAKKIKSHLADSALRQTKLLAATSGHGYPAVAAEQQRLTTEIARYRVDGERIAAKAKALEQQYDALNFHDDQFDMSDAALSIAIAVAAVAALTDNWALLLFSWVSGAFGIAFGLAGFLGWRLHPDWLVNLLT